MFRPITRFVFSALICLALLAGIYTSARGLGHILQRGVANTARAGISASVRVSANSNLARSYYFDSESDGMKSQHDCGSGSQVSPDD